MFQSQNAQKVWEILCNKVFQNTSPELINHEKFIITLHTIFQIFQGKTNIIHLDELLNIKALLNNQEILQEYRNTIESLFQTIVKNGKVLQETNLQYALVDKMRTYFDKYFIQWENVVLVPMRIFIKFQSIKIVDSEAKTLIGKITSQEFQKIIVDETGNFIILPKIYKKQQEIIDEIQDSQKKAA